MLDLLKIQGLKPVEFGGGHGALVIKAEILHCARMLRMNVKKGEDLKYVHALDEHWVEESKTGHNALQNNRPSLTAGFSITDLIYTK